MPMQSLAPHNTLSYEVHKGTLLMRLECKSLTIFEPTTIVSADLSRPVVAVHVPVTPSHEE
jgi:hypothetical protein